MRATDIDKQIDELLSSLDEAEHYGDSNAIQGAYEDLFTLCRKNNLDLNELLRGPHRSNAASSRLSALAYVLAVVLSILKRLKANSLSTDRAASERSTFPRYGPEASG